MLTKEDKKYIDENWLYRTEHELAKELNSTKWYIVKYKEEQQYTGEKKTEFRYNFIRDNKYMTNRQLAKALNVTGATIGNYKDKIYKGREKIEKKEVVDIEIDPMPSKMIPYKLQGNYISKEDISKIKAKEGGFYKVKETDNKNNDSYSNRGDRKSVV